MEQLLTGVQEDCGKNRFGGAGYTDLIWALLILRCLLDIQMGMFSR